MLTTLTAAPLVAAHVAGWGWGFPWFLIFIPLFWIAIFVLIFAFAGRRWRRARWAGEYGLGWGAPSVSAEATLAERFARGDIDETEYRARLEVLRAARPGPGR